MSKITDSDLTLIAELLESHSIKEVAEKFGVYPNTISYHMKKHGIKLKMLKTKSIKSIINKHAFLQSVKEDLLRGHNIYRACERHNITTNQYVELNKIGLETLKAEQANQGEVSHAS